MKYGHFTTISGNLNEQFFFILLHIQRKLQFFVYKQLYMLILWAMIWHASVPWTRQFCVGIEKADDNDG